MEYFDAHNVPEGFLRAKFKTVSISQTERLAELFAPVANALLDQASKKVKLRIGFKAEKNTGKTTLSRRLAECFTKALPEINLYGWSNKYLMSQNRSLLHFDADALKVAKSYPSDNLSMRIQREFKKHEDDYYEACVHLIEWPEKEGNKQLNILWQLSKNSAGERRISLACTDEIAATREYKQFLDAARAEGLLLDCE